MTDVILSTRIHQKKTTSRKAARTGESARVVYEETRRQAGGRAMRFRWPEGTAFTRVVLDVEQSCCGHCGRRWHICDHRIRRIYTLAGYVSILAGLRGAGVA